MFLVDEWIKMLRDSGFSYNTIDAYRSDLLSISNELNGIEIKDATLEQLTWAFNIRKLSGIKITSLKRTCSSLQNYLRFLDGLHHPHVTSSDLVTKSLTFRTENNQKEIFTPLKYKPRKFLQLANPNYMKDKYLNLEMGTEEIAAEVGCSKQAVFKALRMHGIKLRSHSQAWQAAARKGHTRIEPTTINDIFFSNWSPASAYVFGVILADGNLKLSKATNGSERFGSGQVGISQKSSELLEKVGKLMGHSGKMTFQPRRVYGGRVASELYTLRFSSDRVVADLVRLGLRPRKSLVLQFPDVPENVRRHFIRGCWDGDGSVYIDKGVQRVCASYVSGSLKFIEGLVESLASAGIPRVTIYNNNRSTASYYIRYTSSRVHDLFHYFYDNVSNAEYLERKFNLFRMSLEMNPQ